MDKVLITGANGMLACNLIEILAAEGYHIVGMLRNPSAYKGITGQNIRIIRSDFKNPEDFRSAVRGCTGVIHTAAITAQGLRDYEEYRKVNVIPVESMMQICIEENVRRFLYVSTANTIGWGTRENPADENTPWCPPLSDSFYARSKSEAESIVRKYSGSIETIIVNPTFMIGKYGSSKGSNSIFGLAGWLTICPKGGKNFINVEEAARGMVLAYEKGIPGDRYIICGENMSFKEFYRRIPSVKHIITIPDFIMKAVGYLGDLSRIIGLNAAFCSFNMRILCTPDAYSGEKAKKELGFKASELDFIRNCFLR